MKILEIELKNLNSLRGQWRIKLSDSIYEANGIFAITGPTGAGKTTIFDAICLALYGQTPRLSSINEKTNEIMSRKTSECYAKVTFESGGRRYVSMWSQHRSRSNNLQPQKHIVSDADTGKILAETITTSRNVIKEITGLDFRRFRQAVMLEQGGFDAFLKADKNDRAQILELLTGTEIYGKISELVYRRCSDERAKLNDIKFQRDSLRPNDNFESEAEIMNELAKVRENISAAEVEYTEAARGLEWLKTIRKLQIELAENQRDLEQHDKSRELFAVEDEKLDIGERASALSGEFSSLKAQRANLKKISERVEKLKSEIERYGEFVSQLEAQELPQYEETLKRVTQNIPDDDSPETFYAKAGERVKVFATLARQKEDIEHKKRATARQLQEAQATLQASERNCTAHHERYNEAFKKLSNLMTARTEAIFAEARRHLQPQTPCPVCGSTEHPAANHQLETSHDISGLDDALKLAQEQFRIAQKNFDAASNSLSIARANETAARTNFDNLVMSFDEISEQRANAKEEISGLLQRMGISVEKVNEITPRIDAWLTNVKELEEKIRRAHERAEALKAQVEANRKTLVSEISELGTAAEELARLEKNFAERLREKNFDSEAAFSDSIVDDDEMKRLRERKKSLESEHDRLIGVKDSLTKKFETEEAKAVTSKTLAEVEADFKGCERTIKALTEKAHYFKTKLDDRQAMQSRREELDAAYRKQEKIFADWDALSKLIGSAGGDKFRVFAQGITLGMMINLANSQLEKMSGRYVLMARPDSNGLELSVIDREQAGEVRPTDNLSGGERFIISLALALGLSQISGRKSRIDSLFLDEGFGSLDEDSLNMALDALGELRRDGRMIGIISHVQTLRDRIAAQINVIPKREGVSVISVRS